MVLQELLPSVLQLFSQVTTGQEFPKSAMGEEAVAIILKLKEPASISNHFHELLCCDTRRPWFGSKSLPNQFHQIIFEHCFTNMVWQFMHLKSDPCQIIAARLRG